MLISTACACTHTQKKTNKVPPNLGQNQLSAVQLKAVLKDLFLVEAYKSSVLYRNEDSLRISYLKAYYEEIFKKNGVQNTAFFNTFRYYKLTKNKELEQMLNEINTELHKEQP